ncbi:unnamed protein product [Haemonchus placei]|uniref:Uncharacterized protein n=1 Tax=Haemonchus placei TaxID=6290 RepID=A0A3P7WW37_HAEPC|nr:unnamed protein product [Haemonchus placei]
MMNIYYCFDFPKYLFDCCLLHNWFIFSDALQQNVFYFQ